MNVLTGDRFLKRFIGRRPARQSLKPKDESTLSPEYTAETPAEGGCPSGDGQPEEERLLEKNPADETNQIKIVHECFEKPLNN